MLYIYIYDIDVQTKIETKIKCKFKLTKYFEKNNKNIFCIADASNRIPL